MKLTAEGLRAEKTNIFATKDSIQEIVDEMNSVGNTTGTVYVMIAVNTVLEKVAKEMEKNED